MAIGYMLIATLDTMLHRDVIITANALIRMEEWLFLIPLLLGLFAITGARITGSQWGAAVFVALILSESHFFTGTLHDWLMQAGLYPPFAKHGDQVNVQWTALMCYAVLWPILLIQICRSRTRHLGRVFTLIIMTATLGTTFLFHKLVIGVGLRNNLTELRQQQFHAIYQALAAPDQHEFYRLCRKAELWCQQAAKDMSISDSPADFADWIKQENDYLAIRTDVEQRSFSPLSSTLNGNQAVFERSEDYSRVAIDRMGYTPVVARFKIIFALLVGAAHLVWSWGGVGLLALHRSNVRFRLRGNP